MKTKNKFLLSKDLILIKKNNYRMLKILNMDMSTFSKKWEMNEEDGKKVWNLIGWYVPTKLIKEKENTMKKSEPKAETKTEETEQYFKFYKPEKFTSEITEDMFTFAPLVLIHKGETKNFLYWLDPKSTKNYQKLESKPLLKLPKIEDMKKITKKEFTRLTTPKKEKGE